MNRKVRLSIAGVILFFSACQHPGVISPNQSEISFKNEVQPIIIGNCTMAGCHGASTGGEESFPLMTYEDVINHGEINSTKPEKTKFYKSITGKSEEAMPPDGPMSDTQILIIYNWIAQGAKNN